MNPWGERDLERRRRKRRKVKKGVDDGREEREYEENVTDLELWRLI